MYYAHQAPTILGDEKVEIDGVDAWVSYEAIGLVLAVMPWNFPVWQVMRVRDSFDFRLAMVRS